MPLEQVIAAGSTRPSSFLDPTESEDWLKVGQNADLTVFRVDEANISVEDSLGGSSHFNSIDSSTARCAGVKSC